MSSGALTLDQAHRDPRDRLLERDTPASIIESTAAQTLAIDVLPLDDSTSETIRNV